MTGSMGGAPRHVRWATYAIVVLLFALPCIVGRLDTYFVLLFALLIIATPSILPAFRMRSANPIDLLFVAAAALPAFAFMFTAEDAADLLYAFNFAPLLLAVPFRWQIERYARPDGALLVAWLSLAGVTIAFAVAAVQVFGFAMDRVGQPLMNEFQFANTAMLLGFTALVGVFSPGVGRRMPFLLGPVLAVVTVLLSGTRGALLAAPPLALVAFAFAVLRLGNPRRTIAIGIGLVAVTAVVAAIAWNFGLDRAIDGFVLTKNAITGEAVDSNTRERLTMVWGGYQAFLHAPVFGYGWVDMAPAILPYVPADMLERMKTFRQLHNGLASFAVGAGTFGIVSLIILSVAPVVAVLLTPRDDQYTARLYLALVLCVGYAVFQLTFILIGFEFHTFQYAFMTMVFVGLLRPAGTANVGSPPTPSPSA